MVRSFSYSLFITSVFLFLSCKPGYILIDSNSQNTSVSDVFTPIDSQLVRLYLPYKKLLEKDMTRVISFSEVEMIKEKPESGLTNLLADLLLDEGKAEAVKSNLNFIPDVSYFNYGGIRTSLPKGNVTVGKIYELMPFENEMVFIQLSGEQLQQFYNLVAKFGGESVGGVRFTISNGIAKNVMIKGEKLISEREYWMVTNDYSANGGDDLVVFTQRSEFINSGKKIRDIIISNFEERQKTGAILTSNIDGRIVNE